ncbi:Yip1 family protein [Aliikangiella coralliicola]|uniref:YIP1 family protein n=1 Tax=Aliikangiella coralliicola TaxID=2592383 RepID=A0A545U7P4_9GAMM|nr:Yip1 family protein [Aliikangiella coralliicola]TQV85487.1 YIP1 family protein [Aliikangiella coralliicola]
MSNPYQSPATNSTLLKTDEPVEQLNPLISVWLHPRRTIRYVLKVHPEKFVILFAVLSGIHTNLNRAISKGSADSEAFVSIIIAAVIGGAIFGILSLYVFAWLQSISGKWLGGSGTSDELRTASAWSSIPAIVGLIIALSHIVFVGKDLFSQSVEPFMENEILNLAYWGSVVVETLLSVFAFIIYIVFVSEVHKFSIGRSIFCTLLSFLLFFVPIFALIFGIGFISA